MKASEFIVDELMSLGIDKIFGVNGGLIEPFLLEAYNKNLEIVHCASENQASLIAQSYGYEKEKFGVCFCVSGAGQSNLINGLTTAYVENKKMLVISGDNASSKSEKRNLQNTSKFSGVSFSDFINKCTVYSKKITNPDDLFDVFNKAIYKMEKHSRPVHIEIPKDIFEKEIIKKTLKIKKHTKKINYKNLLTIKNIIKKQKTEFFCSSPLRKESLDILLNISRIYNIPIYETPTGKGTIPKEFENYKGCFGLFSNIIYEQESTKNKKFKIFFGNSLNEINTNGWNECVFNDKTILITEEKQNIDPNSVIFENILTDIDDFLKNLNEILKLKNQFNSLSLKNNKKQISIKKHHNGEQKINPEYFFNFFQSYKPEKSIAFFDNGNSMAWGIKTWEDSPVFYENMIQSFRIGIGISSMGWGLGYSIGAAMAHKDKGIHIYCFIGDGSILMSSQEIAFFRKYNLPITFIILNDSSLGMVYHGQKIAIKKHFAHDLPTCNFKDYFKSCGVNAVRIKNQKDLNKKKHKIFEGDYKVIDLVIDPEIPSPISDRVKNLKAK